MNLKKITVPLVLLILSLGVSAQQQETFNNPVINADVPDPSMIRVGDYYCVLFLHCSFRYQPEHNTVILFFMLTCPICRCVAQVITFTWFPLLCT